MKQKIISLWDKLTLATKIVFVLWSLNSLYMLFSGKSGVNFFQWIIVWIFGCFIFCGITQLISIKKKKQKYPKNELIPDQEKAYIEYQKALKNMGESFSNFFKEAYYVNATLLGSDSFENYYLFTYKAESKDQLNYLLSSQEEMFEKLDGNPVFNILFDTTFQMKIENVTQHRKPTDYNSSCTFNNFDIMGGHDFEYFCADLLKKNDFKNVEVTKGSGDQGVDIVAEKDSIKYAIQCKCYSNDIGNKAVQEVFSGRTFYNCHVAVVLTNRYFTQSAKELASKNNVLLWDRDYLEKLISISNKDNN